MKTFKEYIDKNWDYNGNSAKCLYGFYQKKEQDYAYPHDPDDLCRVLQVMRLIDADYRKEIMADLADHYGKKANHWRMLYNHWNQLMDIFSKEWDGNTAPKTFDYMKKLYNVC